MKTNIVYEGTCTGVMKDFPDKSIDCIITSPPYWQLRDYGWNGQWGLEPTYEMYLLHLWMFMNEAYRVLKDTGTVWVNLGDTYGTQSGNFNKPEYNGTSKESNHLKDSAEIKQPKSIHKCLLLIPHRFAIGCIDRGWIMRNDLIWAKRNGMPESVTDRFSKKHEYFFFMVKSEKYYFDLDSVRLATKQVSIDRMKRAVSENNKWVNGADGQTPHNLSQPRSNRSGTKYVGERLGWTGEKSTEGHELGPNPGSVSDFWDIPTKPSKDAHFASYNTSLVDKPIIAGCHIGGIILDPFAGTCTTGVRAVNLQRKFIGIEGKPEYVKMGNKKLNAEIVKLQLF